MSKVFIGPNNTAGNAALIATALRAVGVKADSYCYTKHPFGYNTDYVIKQINSENLNYWQKKIRLGAFIYYVNVLLRILFFSKVLISYDAFIFISTSSIFRNRKDLKIIKFFKKKIALIFIGCPERNPMAKINITNKHCCTVCTDDEFQRFNNCQDIDQKREIIESMSNQADFIFAFRDLVDLIPENKFWNPLYFITKEPKKKDSELLNKYNSPDVINIVHLPTNKTLKGTNHIEKAMKNICKKYGKRINYKSSILSNVEVINTLERTHILIDQMHVYYALLSVEAMSLGCVVLCRLPDWFEKDMKKSPIVNINEHNLEHTIKSLIDNQEKMKTNGKKSIQFYNKYHSPISVGNYYKKIMDLK